MNIDLDKTICMRSDDGILLTKGVITSITLNWEAFLFVQLSSDISNFMSTLSSDGNFKTSLIHSFIHAVYYVKNNYITGT